MTLARSDSKDSICSSMMSNRSRSASSRMIFVSFTMSSHSWALWVSIIWEGMKAQPTFSLPSPALCEFRHSGRSLHSQMGGAPAGGAYCKRGHRLFHGLAPRYPFRVPQLPGVYCKTSVVQPAFLTFPLCCFDQISCWLPRNTPWKCIKINGFEPAISPWDPLWSHEPGHTPWCLGGRHLRSDLTWDDSTAIWACNCLRTKHFHGVSAGHPHPYWLKSRYGKVRCLWSSPFTFLFRFGRLKWTLVSKFECWKNLVKHLFCYLFCCWHFYPCNLINIIFIWQISVCFYYIPLYEIQKSEYSMSHSMLVW